MDLSPCHDDGLWAYAAGEAALGQVLEAMPALDGLNVVCGSLSPGLAPFAVHGSARTDPAHLDILLRDYLDPADNPAFRHSVHGPTGRFVHRAAFMSWDAIRAMPFYEDFWRPTGVGPEAGTVRFPVAGLGDVLVSIGVPEGREELAPARGAAIERAMRHLRRAMELAARLSGRTALAAQAARGGLATVIVDEAGAVLAAHEDAGATFHRRAALSMVGGTLSWHGAPEEARLDAAFSAALAGREARVSLPPGDCGGGPLTVAMAPGPPALDRPTVAVTVLRPRPADWTHASLADAYGLTAREADMALGLLAGRRPAEIAAALGILPGSARLYLKRVFAKTGTDGQVPLVALLAGTAGR